MERTCQTCEFWDQQTSHRDKRNVGLCRFDPPRRNGNDDVDYCWPDTYDEDWCGKWTKREEDSGN